MDFLILEICIICCGCVGYQYFVLKKGEQCWCFDVVILDSGVGDLWCDDLCIGNIVLCCGGLEVYSVYEVLGKYNFFFELIMLMNIFVYERIIVEILSYMGVLNMLDFGEDVVFIIGNMLVLYFYYLYG